MSLERLYLSLPHLLLTCRHIVAIVYIVNKDIAVPDGAIETGARPDVSVWLRGFLQSVTHIEERETGIARVENEIMGELPSDELVGTQVAR